MCSLRKTNDAVRAVHLEINFHKWDYRDVNGVGVVKTTVKAII